MPKYNVIALDPDLDKPGNCIWLRGRQILYPVLILYRYPKFLCLYYLWASLIPLLFLLFRSFYQLCDFGLLRPMNSRTTTMAVGSSGYMAPETVRACYDYEKVDIFAFGVLQLELLTGLPVICAKRRADLVSYVEKVTGNEENITPLLDKGAGDWTELGQRWYSEVVLDAVQLSPNRRCAIVECLQRLEVLMCVK